MNDHEKRIREAVASGESFSDNDLRALLADLDRLRDNMTNTPAMPELHRDQIIDLISPLSKNSAYHDIEFANRVIDALAALSEAKAGGWQPIETAPKDGRLILVSFGAKGVRAVSWDTSFDDVEDEDTGLWCVDDDKHGPYPLRGYSYNSPTAPTHWQPLPNPPKEQA